MLPLVLLLTEVDTVTQEKCCKRNTVGALGSSDGKMILTLLAEVITFYIRLTTIDVRWSDLQWYLSGVVKGRNSGFKDSSGDLLQILLYILSNRRLNSKRVAGVSSWLDSGRGENPNRSSEVRSLQRYLETWIEVILVVGIERSGINTQ